MGIVLVLGDEAKTRSRLVEALAQEGVEAVAIGSEQEGPLDARSRDRVQALVVDGAIAADELISELERRSGRTFSSTPMIVLSESQDPSRVERRLGACIALSKPVRAFDLARAVRACAVRS